ncbi:CAS1 domain-containing protein [Raphidocelis subcapitata]|uniref:CAS1 domain-containing protein n=1 Tax=Raphidocelis subcapitata TaxID=307507 RepID=A0A2V0NUB2_9CHLO|nr:CAS1 domain-containing protein [Raphidocelis subcapitata]|eukprot:GBF88415.1 CAS1 domain-containing protein [Raphidocelis subcapitata]
MGEVDLAAAAPEASAASVPSFSVGQVACLLTYLWALALYFYALLLHSRRPKTLPKVHISDAHLEKERAIAAAAAEAAPLVNGSSSSDGGAAAKPKGFFEDMGSSGLIQCVLMNQQALMDNKDTLLAIVEFGTIMLWFFLADRTDVLPASDKAYDRDLFLFIFLVLTIVAFSTSLQPVRTPLVLNRPQTEEWKGWMQVLFLLYHYFEAKEAYNAIRIFIAGYVWMTGFGNFSYYYRTGDFGIGRFCQMMWRLNFMVFFCCVVLQNEYMLYYICPMHTLFTVMVYAALALAPQLNKSHPWLWIKIAGCFLTVLIFWDIKAVFMAVWRPFDWFMGYTDPRNPEVDRMHEWFFRSSLDRYIWVYGMVCAMLHPMACKFLTSVDELPSPRRWTVRAAIVACTVAVFAVYYKSVYVLPKLEYNVLHPYTSWIPLTCWMIVRNLTPQLRTWSMRLYGWLGCITLETYLSQFHIWLRSSVPNGQPKYLLAIVPGYPLLNFAICTALYVFVSHRLFLVTNALKDAVVPHDNNRTLLRNIILMGVMMAACTAMGFFGHTLAYALS